MAEVAPQNPPSLAEQYSLQDIEKTDQVVVSADKTPEKDNPVDASPEEIVVAKTGEIPASEVIAENTSETPAPEVVPENNDDTPAAEEGSAAEETNDETAAEQETEVAPVEEKPEIKLETAPADFRFPTTNQTRHCFTRYIEYHRCVAAKGEDASECNKFAKYYRSLCPSEWRTSAIVASQSPNRGREMAEGLQVERWNEQRENGTFPGPL